MKRQVYSNCVENYACNHLITDCGCDLYNHGRIQKRLYGGNERPWLGMVECEHKQLWIMLVIEGACVAIEVERNKE